MATEQMVWLSSTDPQAMLRYLTNNGLVSDRQLRMFVEAVTGIHVWVNLGADFDWLGFANEVITSEHAKHHPSLSVQAALLREIFGNPFRPEDLNRIVINSPVGPGTITGYNSHGFPRVNEVTCVPSKITTAEESWLTPDIIALARSIPEEKKCERCGGHGYAAHYSTTGGHGVCLDCHGSGRILDWSGMGPLADMLEEAGCDNEDILQHCRGLERLVCTRCDGDGKAHGADRPFEWTPEKGYPGPCPVCSGSRVKGWQPLRTPHCRGCWALRLLRGVG